MSEQGKTQGHTQFHGARSSRAIQGWTPRLGVVCSLVSRKMSGLFPLSDDQEGPANSRVGVFGSDVQGSAPGGVGGLSLPRQRGVQQVPQVGGVAKVSRPVQPRPALLQLAGQRPHQCAQSATPQHRQTSAALCSGQGSACGLNRRASTQIKTALGSISRDRPLRCVKQLRSAVQQEESSQGCCHTKSTRVLAHQMRQTALRASGWPPAELGPATHSGGVQHNLLPTYGVSDNTQVWRMTTLAGHENRPAWLMAHRTCAQ